MASTALRLTGDDLFQPSVACIKPIGGSGNGTKGTSNSRKEKLEKVSINLNDCLACSGCITSAESVLITSQSVTEARQLFERAARDGLVVVLSLSEQALSSLAVAQSKTVAQVV